MARELVAIITLPWTLNPQAPKLPKLKAKRPPVGKPQKKPPKYNHLPTWNQYMRLTWRNSYAGGQMVQDWKDAAVKAIEAYYESRRTTPRRLTAVDVEVWNFYPDLTRRDPHNVFYKPVLDAMTATGMVKDDDDIELTIKRKQLDRLNPRTEFRVFTPIEELPEPDRPAKPLARTARKKPSG